MEEYISAAKVEEQQRSEKGVCKVSENAVADLELESDHPLNPKNASLTRASDSQQMAMQGILGQVDFVDGLGATSPFDTNDTDVIDLNDGRNDVQVIDITPYMT